MTMFGNVIEELTAFYKLEDKVPSSSGQSVHCKRDTTIANSQFTPVLPDIVKTDDIRMLN